jgi:hypothetical protein
MDESAGDGCSLHFTTTELMGIMSGPVGHPHQIEHGHRLRPHTTGAISAQQEWQFGILRNRHGGEEVEKLEDNPEFCPPEEGQFLIPGIFQVNAVHHHFTGSWAIQSPQKIENSTLSGTARAGDCNKLAPPDFQRKRIQGSNRGRTVGAGGFDESNHGVHK